MYFAPQRGPGVSRMAGAPPETTHQNELLDKYKKLISDYGVIILCAKKGDKLSFLIGVTDQLTDKIGADEIAKFASSISNGKGGGGRKDFAQSGGMLINEDDQKRELRKFIIGKLQ